MHAASSSCSSFPAAGRDRVGALLHAVGDALENVAGAAPLDDGQALKGYLGDVVEIALNGAGPERAALLAKLLLLCAASSAPDGRDVTRWLRRFERLLRGWDRERRAAAAPPRPLPDDLEASVAMLYVARATPSLLPLNVAAFELAEVAAIHVICGTTTVEQALAAADELAPLLDEASMLLDGDEQRLAAARPGAWLARLAHAARHASRQLRTGSARSAAADNPSGRSREAAPRVGVPLLLELAAGLLSAHDAYEQLDDHDHSWRIVRDRTIELMVVGELAEDPAAVDVASALDEAQAAAVALAGHWLDTLYADVERELLELGPSALEASSRCLVAAWSAAKRP
jgi:hypothetical protein